MDTAMQAPATDFLLPETPDQRLLRLERERVIVERAEAELDSGLGIELDELEAWFDQLDRNPDAEPPQSRFPPVTLA